MAFLVNLQIHGTDLTKEFDIDISVKEDSEVTETISILTNLVGSNSTYTLNMGINYETIEEDSLSINLTSEIEFTDEIEIEDLTEENSVSIEDLSEEQLTEISELLQKVLNNKLSEIAFIDINTNEILVSQNSEEEEDETLKQEAKEALIAAVQEEMTLALELDKEYTIQDLSGLEVEGYSVIVLISENIATIDIDGYIFYIDSGFNLSE